MEIYHNDLAFLMEKETLKIGIFQDWQGYVIESYPVADEVKMCINSSFKSPERAVYNTFKQLMVNLFGEYTLQGKSHGITFNPREKTITIIGGSAKNSITLQYLDDSIILTLTKNPDLKNNNNRVILDKDGAIFLYLPYFNEFFKALTSIQNEPNYSKSKRI